jgi:hypothetical protein
LTTSPARAFTARAALFAFQVTKTEALEDAKDSAMAPRAGFEAGVHGRSQPFVKTVDFAL